MSILIGEIVDYKSTSGSSDGGAISATKVKIGQLSQQANAAQAVARVYDSSPFSNGEVVVFDDGVNKEEKTIQTVDSATQITFTTNFANTFAAETPFSVKQNLFLNITAAQSGEGASIYKKFFRKNTHATLALTSPRTYIPNQLENAVVSVGIGLDHADDADSGQGNMLPLAANDTVQVVSDGADTRQVTISGVRSSDNTYVTENIALNGTTPVTSSNTFKAGCVVRAYVASLNASRAVTIRRTTGAATIGTIGPNKKICWLWFGKRIVAGVFASAEGGDRAGGATLDDTNSILTADIAAGGNLPLWTRVMVAAGSAAATNSSAVIATQGGTE